MVARTPSLDRFSALALMLFCCAVAAPTRLSAQGAPSALEAMVSAMREAERQVEEGELQVAESRYRSALLEGWLASGLLKMAGGGYGQALEAFSRAEVATVETRRPRVLAASARLQLGESEAAAEILRRVAGENPMDFEARRLLARAMAAGGQLDGAIQELEELRTLTPENLENTFLLATAYLRQGSVEKAEALFAELIAARPIPPSYVLLGRIYRDFDHLERARQALETALELDPSTPRAHFYLGTVALLDEGRGLLDEAIAHFEAELEVAPSDPMTNLYLGIGLVDSRRFEEALPRLELAARSPVSQRDALQFLGRCYLGLGRAAEAVPVLRRALELALSERAEAPAGAMIDLGESQLSTLNYQLALALRRSGEEEAANVHFEAAKEHSAKLAESTREILERFLKDETSEPLSAVPVGLTESADARESAAAREALASSIERTLAQAHFNLAVLQTRSGRFSRSAELFAEAAELAPDYPRVQYSLGVALFNAGEFREATAPLSRAFEQDADDTALRRMLALAWFNSEQYEEAVALLRNDLELESNPSLQYAYGVALVRSGRAAEAEAVFSSLLARHSDRPELNVLLGQAYAQQDDYEAAISALRQALELDPSVAEAHGTLGDIYFRQGRLDQAEAELRAELRSHPENERALYTLATVVDHNRRSDEALELLEGLLERNPEHANGRYLLGKILLAKGSLEDARSQLEAAASLAPQDANIRYQLGQSYRRLGLLEEAEKEFEVYRQLKRDGQAGEES